MNLIEHLRLQQVELGQRLDVIVPVREIIHGEQMAYTILRIWLEAMC